MYPNQYSGGSGPRLRQINKCKSQQHYKLKVPLREASLTFWEFGTKPAQTQRTCKTLNSLLQESINIMHKESIQVTNMGVVAKKCGIKFDPPSIVLIYENEGAKKLRKRVIPVRNLSQFSDCSRAAERLKHQDRHAPYLQSVPLPQLVRLHTVLRDHLRGLSVEESLKAQRAADVPEQDLSKLGDEELNRHKAQMDVLFERNRRRKDDPDFVYDIEVEFPENSVRETCSWDQSDDEF